MPAGSLPKWRRLSPLLMQACLIPGPTHRGCRGFRWLCVRRRRLKTCQKLHLQASRTRISTSCGTDALLLAVKKCWASLWTARAIAYRMKNNIDQGSVALAVVVQELVFAEAAGILFTANPINGKRSELVINAAWGLGEAVVSGAVTPDTITVDKTTGKLIRREIASKQVMTVRTDQGTREVPVPEAQKGKAVLTDAQASELARLGVKIEQFYGTPMDVEWALSAPGLAGGFAILQARPITALPPEWVRPNPKAIYARGSLAEHLPNPVTPLFGTLGLRTVNIATAELEDLMKIDLLEAEYQYRVVNGYVFMGFVLSGKIVWGMLRAAVSGLKLMLSQGSERWQVSRRELEKILARSGGSGCKKDASV